MSALIVTCIESWVFYTNAPARLYARGTRLVRLDTEEYVSVYTHDNFGTNFVPDMGIFSPASPRFVRVLTEDGQFGWINRNACMKDRLCREVY